MFVGMRLYQVNNFNVAYLIIILYSILHSTTVNNYLQYLREIQLGARGRMYLRSDVHNHYTNMMV